MTDIVAFLNARLNEDEQLAHAACGFHDFKPYGASKSRVYTWWTRSKPNTAEPEGIVHRRSGEDVATIRYLEAADHIARHDPARVLREVAAKRAIVEFCDDDPLFLDGGWAYTDRVLRLLAAAYAEHPDYDTAWTV